MRCGFEHGDYRAKSSKAYKRTGQRNTRADGAGADQLCRHGSSGRGEGGKPGAQARQTVNVDSRMGGRSEDKSPNTGFRARRRQTLFYFQFKVENSARFYLGRTSTQHHHA